LTTIAN